MKNNEIELANTIWAELKKYIPNKDHKKLARWLFDVFRNRGAYSGYTGELTLLERDGKVHQ